MKFTQARLLPGYGLYLSAWHASGSPDVPIAPGGNEMPDVPIAPVDDDNFCLCPVHSMNGSSELSGGVRLEPAWNLPATLHFCSLLTHLIQAKFSCDVDRIRLRSGT